MALSPETLIFVDIDGVLNVGIRDGGGKMAPISFSLDNLNKALGVLQKIQHGGEIDVESANTVDKLVSVALHSLEDVDEESTTYHELLTNSPHAPGNLDLIYIFVRRLAIMIRVAGPRRLVVLSSTWRKPQYARKVEQLEKAIAVTLGEPFAFDARTSLKEDRSVAGRLNGIRAFIEDYVAASQNMAGPLRVLVLDDFHNTPLNGWKCNGYPMSSVRDVEAYLEGSIPLYLGGAARLIHTYAEWKTESGRLVQIGSGMTANHFRDGVEFLSSSSQQLPLDQKARSYRRPRLGLENIEEETTEYDSCSSETFSEDACEAEKY